LAFVRGVEQALACPKSKKLASPASLARILRDSERQIREVQRRTGCDFYWRVYFFLTCGGAD
jgi:hypothetical protein